MKYLVSSKKAKAVNLSMVTDLSISGNYLMLTTNEGREMRFFFGTPAELDRLFPAVIAFLSTDEVTFDCDEFLSR